MSDHLGLIELLFVFGVGLALVAWELFSVLRSSARDRKDMRDDEDASS